MHFYYRDSYAYIPLETPYRRVLKIIAALMEVTDEAYALPGFQPKKAGTQ